MTRVDAPIDSDPDAAGELTRGSVGGYPRGKVPFEMRGRQIVLVAQQLFATNGYEATGIVDIARAAGVTRPVVYKHFDSKEAIYLAILRAAREELLLEMAEAIAADGPPVDKVRGAAEAYFRYTQRNPPAWQIMFGGTAVSGQAATEQAKLRAETIGFLTEQVHQLAPNSSRLVCEAFAHALCGSAEQIVTWWGDHPNLDRTEVIDCYLAFSWPALDRLMAE